MPDSDVTVTGVFEAITEPANDDNNPAATYIVAVAPGYGDTVYKVGDTFVIGYSKTDKLCTIFERILKKTYEAKTNSSPTYRNRSLLRNLR